MQGTHSEAQHGGDHVAAGHSMAHGNTTKKSVGKGHNMYGTYTMSQHGGAEHSKYSRKSKAGRRRTPGGNIACAVDAAAAAAGAALAS